MKFVPWALAALLAVGAWRPWPWAGRFVAVYPFGLLLAPVFGAAEIRSYVVAALIAGAVAAFRAKGLRAAAWATVFLMAADALLGGWISARTPLSYSPLEAARFYGIGNEAGGYLIGAGILAAGSDLLTTALLGVAVSALLGAPTLGANFGCFLASLAGFGAAIFARLPKSRRLFGALGLTIIAALAVFLVVRGSAGTHVGRAGNPIQLFDGRPTVFIAKPNQAGGATFIRRTVETGSRTGAKVPVTRGLAAGELVVTAGAFSIKAELQKSSMPAMEM